MLWRQKRSRGDCKFHDETSVQSAEAEKGHFMYAHEVSSGTIPALADAVHIPRYFMNNYGDVTPGANLTVDEMVAATHFPAFFFGSQGSSSPLHSDGALLRARRGQCSQSLAQYLPLFCFFCLFACWALCNATDAPTCDAHLFGGGVACLSM